MQVRVYDFVTGIETGTQPDAGTPSSSNDLITKGYADTQYGGTETQETCSGVVNNSNVTFTVSNTPSSAGSFKLYLSGRLIDNPGDYSISGTTITMVVAPNFGQTLRANYKY